MKRELDVALKDNLTKVKILLNIIGSPFNPPILEPNYEDSIELYEIARKNKIGLLFLEKLEEKGKLNNELQLEINKQREAHETLRTTAERAASILNKSDCKYAVVKSKYPFPVVLSDVDILIFGGTKEYKHAIKSMTSSYFELMGEAPLESMLHDKRGKHSEESLEKDPCDVDVYREIGAGYIKYMNKNKFSQSYFSSEITSNGVKLNTLKASCELALNMFHSIYPEKIFTLLLHYYTLFSIKMMDSADKAEFLGICKDQNIAKAVLLILNMIETIQETCFGESPRELTGLREDIGKREYIPIDKLPYNYPTRMLLEIFWGKRKDMVFTASVIRQGMAMLNPKYARYVMAIFKDRQNRETY